jgi:hypothetical protein
MKSIRVEVLDLVVRFRVTKLASMPGTLSY